MFKFGRVESEVQKKIYGALIRFCIIAVIAIFLRIFLFSHLAVPLFTLTVIGIIFYLIDKYFHDTHPRILKLFVSVSVFFLVWLPQGSKAARSYLPPIVQSWYEEYKTDKDVDRHNIEAKILDIQRNQKRLDELNGFRKSRPLTNNELEEEKKIMLEINNLKKRQEELQNLKENGLPEAKVEPLLQPLSSPVATPTEQPIVESAPVQAKATPVQVDQVNASSDPTVVIPPQVPEFTPTKNNLPLLVVMPIENTDEVDRVINKNDKKHPNILTSIGVGILKDLEQQQNSSHPIDGVIRANQKMVKDTADSNRPSNNTTRPTTLGSQLQAELLNVVVASNKFQVLDSSARIRQTSNLYLYSSLSYRSLKLKKDSSNKEVTDFLNPIVSGNQQERLLQAITTLALQKNDTLVCVLITLRTSNGTKIINSAFGIGVAKARNKEDLQNAILFSLRSAVEDGLSKL